MIVLDASAGLSRVLPSQRTPAALALFSRRPVEEFIVPAVFEGEISNALLRAARQGRFDAALIETAMAEMLRIVEVRSVSAGGSELRAMALEDVISFFDAHYLMLALAEGAALASRDGPLLAAALRRGVSVEDLR